MVGKLFARLSKRILALVVVFTIIISPINTVTEAFAAVSKSNVKYTSSYMKYSDAVKYVRKCMVERQSKIKVKCNYSSTDPNNIYDDLWNDVMAETGYENEGDYLVFHIKEWNAGGTYYTVSRNNYKMTLEYSVIYRSTAKQEEAVDAKLDKIFKDFKFNQTTPTYDKVKAIYDYIAQNVVYDDDEYDAYMAGYEGNPHTYSAYAALIDNKAVCQGYSTLLYRMLLRAGVSCRFIYSDDMWHSWNIIKIGRKYYNVDVTWDSQLYHGGLPYAYFLKGNNKFTDHDGEVMDIYKTKEFAKNYPVAKGNYKYNSLHKSSVEEVIYSKNTIKGSTPAKTLITSINNVKGKKVKLKFDCRTKKTGYAIRYSTNKKIKKYKKITTKKSIATIKNLKKGKIYYFKVRAYQKINGKTVYGKWSEVSSVKVKK